MINTLEDLYETVGNGTLFRNEKGISKLHSHLAGGRDKNWVFGEIREGVKVWHLMEVVITELVNCSALRKYDITTGFELLHP